MRQLDGTATTFQTGPHPYFFRPATLPHPAHVFDPVNDFGESDFGESDATPTLICGAGTCSSCSCTGYTKDLNSDNDYCQCGHSYGRHY